jgi:hypothetical protein
MGGRRWVALVLVAVLVAACSGSDDGDEATGKATSTTATSVPAGPAVRLAPLSGGTGVFVATPEPDDLAGAGYTEREYAASGTATSYAADGRQGADGRWAFTEAGSAPFTTRVLVRTPEDRSRFSGTVLVEWLNVSGGVDAEPEWSSLHEELTRSGDAWVGVSAQGIGVEGGPIAVKVEGVPGADQAGEGLKGIDPARYGSLSHPGDGYSFDIFTQVARAIRAGDGLDGLTPERVLAGGESQSAFALTTYYDGVQPITKAFDGFFVHSRGGPGLALPDPGRFADIAGALGGTPVAFRDDLAAPVMDIQAESDVAGILASAAARQDDSDTFRLWEVAGTAHADAHLLGSSARYVDCGVPINDGPLHVVAKAAWHALKAWVADGTPPPTAPRLELAGTPPATVRDADGIAKGGLRTPPVQVPVAVLSGNPGPNPSTICLLLGSTTPLPAATLAARYPSRDAYRQRYEAAADEAIAAGYVLRADRDALLAYAHPERLPG